MGHSLGARIIYYLLDSLKHNNKVKINDVFLLGGAVGNQTEDWNNATKNVTGKVINCYSEDDDILMFLYEPSSLFQGDPIGYYPVKNPSKLININAREVAGVKGHTEHKKNFHKILSFIEKNFV